MQLSPDTKQSCVEYLSTPLGWLSIAANNDGLTSVLFVEEQGQDGGNIHTANGKAQLQQYFAGQRQTFDVALSASGTAFQQQVWQQLCRVDYATTCSYAEIANKIGNPKAVRAVGAANGKNPLSIIVPCHRVIGANGTLTGYAGGLTRKEWLLNWEQQHK